MPEANEKVPFSQRLLGMQQTVRSLCIIHDASNLWRLLTHFTHLYNYYYVTICVQADAGLPDPMLEAAHTGTHDGHATLGRYHRSLHIGAKVAEATNELHLVARSQDTIGHHTLFTIGLNFGFRPVDLESLF